jgi:hypothetical protein
MSPKNKIKIDFLKKEEVSPYLINLRKEEKRKISFQLPVFNFKKFSIILFLVILFFSFFSIVLVNISQIPEIKKEILDDVDKNLEMFFQAVDDFKNLKLEEASEKFDYLSENFSKKSEELEKENFFIKIVFNIYPPAKTTTDLLKILKDSSKVGSLLAKTTFNFLSLIKTENLKEENSSEILPQKVLNLDFLKLTEILKENGEKVAFLVEKIDKKISKMNFNYLPKDFKVSLNLLRKEISPLLKNIKDFNDFLKNFEKIVGKNSFKRYLLLFQNNNEIRATGGFLGTYAEITFENGKIKEFKMPAGGTYDLVGGLKVRVAPPKPFFIAYPNWKFHDANWFPDWPTSARKLMWFYEKSDQPTVDGVIALNADLISDILGITGEIYLPKYEKSFNSENFIFEIQKTIEIERKEERKPKQVLVDLTPALLEKIFSLQPDKFLKMVDLLLEEIKKKNILFYFSDKEIQKFFQEKNWAGEIKKSPFDYLMVNVSNVNGAKTEKKIEQKIFYKIEIEKNGGMIATLTIKRKHHGEKEEPFFGKRDLSWIRAYLPKGSVFLGAKIPTIFNFPEVEKIESDKDLEEIEKEISIDNFSKTRITEEFDKTCFGNFLEIEPKEEKELNFKYLLPLKFDFNKKVISYSLLIQKQPGRETEFEAEIILPIEKEIVWSHPENEIKKEGNVIKFSSKIDSDKIFAFVLK